jgi:hypothetical protein
MDDGATMHVRVRQATLEFTDKWGPRFGASSWRQRGINYTSLTNGAHGVGRHLGVSGASTCSRVSRLFERAAVPSHGCCGGWPGETGTVGTDVVGPVPGT